MLDRQVGYESRTAWTYLVVSSGGQEDTLPHQRAWAKQVALKNGWAITETFEGVSSGKGGVRALLDTLLKKLGATPKAKRPTRILMLRIDRLGRGDGLDAMAALAEIRKLGPVLHTRDDGDVTMERTADVLGPMFKTITAAFENEARRDKAMAVYDRKRRAGQVIGNKPPYGLKIDDGKYKIVETEATAVREAFAMRAKGTGYYTIAKRLTQIAEPQTFRNGKVQVIKWTDNRVLRLLANEAYRESGLIDEITWKRASNHSLKVSREVPTRKHPWPLAGALQCECGKTLLGHSTGHGARIRYYKCTAIWAHDGHYIMHPADGLEDEFVRLLKAFRATPSLIDKYTRSAATKNVQERAGLQKEVARLRNLIAEIDRSRDAVFDLYQKGKVREDDVQPRLDSLRQKKNEQEDALRSAERQLSAVEVQETERADVAAIVSQAARIWSQAGRAGQVEQQKALAKAVGRKLGGLTVGVAHHTLLVGVRPETNPRRRPKRSEE